MYAVSGGEKVKSFVALWRRKAEKERNKTMDASFEQALRMIRKMGDARGYGPLARLEEHEHIWFFFHASAASLVEVGRTRVLTEKEAAQLMTAMDRLVFALGRALVVFRSSVTTSVRKVLERLPVAIELWRVSELQYDIREHAYYCPHVKMTAEEVDDLVRQLSPGAAADKIKPTAVLAHMPKILKTDPVVRFFGYQRGDVLRINRSDGSVFFRVVR
ncbi:hypothetical protein EBZ80_12245 [bacterium]|nr:hypothetical protein [bacterium]